MSKRPSQDRGPDPVFGLLIGAVAGGLGTGGYHILSGVRRSRVDTITGTVETDLAFGVGLGMAIVGIVLLVKSSAGRNR